MVKDHKYKEKEQTEVILYSLDGHSLGIKEKIQIEIGEKLEENEQGIEEFIKFVDSWYERWNVRSIDRIQVFSEGPEVKIRM